MSIHYSSPSKHEGIKPPSFQEKESSTESQIRACAYIYQCLSEKEERYEEAEICLELPKKAPEIKENYFYNIYRAMMGQIECHESLFHVSARLLDENAKFQQNLTDMQGKMRYVDIPDGAGMDKISQVTKENQQIDADRSKLQGLLAVSRQKASLDTAKISASVQDMNCEVSEVAGFQEKLNATIESIAQLSRK